MQLLPSRNTHTDVTGTGVEDQRREESSYNCDRGIINRETIQGDRELSIALKTLLKWKNIHLQFYRGQVYVMTYMITLFHTLQSV